MAIAAFLFFLVLLMTLAYLRASLMTWVIATALVAVAYLFAPVGLTLKIISAVIAIVLMILCIVPLRRSLVSDPLFVWFQKALPGLSRTEQEALDAGTVWWDAELFSGKPQWSKLLSAPKPTLTEKELSLIHI